MAQGLQVFDANSNLVMDSSMRFSTYHARYVINGGTATSMYQSIPGFALDGTWAIYCSNFYVQVIPEAGGVVIRGARVATATPSYRQIGTVYLYVFRV